VVQGLRANLGELIPLPSTGWKVQAVGRTLERSCHTCRGGRPDPRARPGGRYARRDVRDHRDSGTGWGARHILFATPTGMRRSCLSGADASVQYPKSRQPILSRRRHRPSLRRVDHPKRLFHYYRNRGAAHAPHPSSQVHARCHPLAPNRTPQPAAIGWRSLAGPGRRCQRTGPGERPTATPTGHSCTSAPIVALCAPSVQRPLQLPWLAGGRRRSTRTRALPRCAPRRTPAGNCRP
jgi:hypothetical protein